MIIIETCPRCGHDLVDTMLAVNPPISRKECPLCGWFWEEEHEQVIRVPFSGNRSYHPRASTSSACEMCPSHPSNGGDGICHCVLGVQAVYQGGL